MALRKLVAGNWKMNGSIASLAELDSILAAAQAQPSVDVAVCPPFTLIAPAAARVPALAIGAQDCHGRPSGAHTGCVAAPMLVEAGARLAIVGHSERRADQHETDEEVRAKATAAIAAGLIAIVCVGETESERDTGRAVAVVEGQLEGSIPRDGTGATLVVAYEPVWAIGTGRTATPDDAAQVHELIRFTVGRRGVPGRVPILYGGSVNAGNVLSLLARPELDGVLVGGASLDPDAWGELVGLGGAA